MGARHTDSHPAKAVRATQEYGDQEMTYKRITMSAIFAIFHSFFIWFIFLIESLGPPSPLIFPTALLFPSYRCVNKQIDTVHTRRDRIYISLQSGGICITVKYRAKSKIYLLLINNTLPFYRKTVFFLFLAQKHGQIRS